RLRGHALEPCQGLARAVGGDCREALVEDLRARVSAEREVARARTVEVASENELSYVRAVELKRRAVAARLAVVRSPREEPQGDEAPPRRTSTRDTASRGTRPQ